MGWWFIEASLTSYMDLIIIWFHDGGTPKKYYSEKTKSFSSAKIKTQNPASGSVFKSV